MARSRNRLPCSLMCIGLIALYHSLLAVVLMQYWVAASAGLQQEKLELTSRVADLSGRLSVLQLEAAAREARQQLQTRSVPSLQSLQGALEPSSPTPSHAASPLTQEPPMSGLPAAPVPPTARCTGAPPPAPDPSPSSASVITVGNQTRITLLTAATLRLEHLGSSEAAAGRFDDRASFAFVHRRLAPPAYQASLAPCSLLVPPPAAGERCLVVSTAQLRLEYLARGATDAALRRRPQGGYEGGWEAEAPSRRTLAVRLLAMGGGSGDEAVWWPGKANPRQLPGTLRTLDNVDGGTAG